MFRGGGVLAAVVAPNRAEVSELCLALPEPVCNELEPASRARVFTRTSLSLAN